MSQTIRRGRVIAASVAAGVVFLAGCGGADDKSETPDVAPLAQIASKPSAPAQNGIDQLEPAAALARSVEAMNAAGTFRVTGTTNAGSTLDLAFQAGVGTTGAVDSGSVVKLRAVDGSVYVTGDPKTIADQVGADVDETIADKWLAVPRDEAAGFAIFISAGAFADAVLGSSAPAEISSVTDVDGQQAVGLLFPATGATLWVAATGEPLPIRFEEKGASGGQGVLTFSEYGSDVKVTPPDPKTVVDPATE